jgi:hypothetical protein
MLLPGGAGIAVREETTTTSYYTRGDGSRGHRSGPVRVDLGVREEATLFVGQPVRQAVWISHRVSVVFVARGFTVTAKSGGPGRVRGEGR